jgi:hypothetical protein
MYILLLLVIVICITSSYSLKTAIQIPSSSSIKVGNEILSESTLNRMNNMANVLKFLKPSFTTDSGILCTFFTANCDGIDCQFSSCSAQIEATGAIAGLYSNNDIVFSDNGTLPVGMSLSPTGLLSGTPDTAANGFTEPFDLMTNFTAIASYEGFESSRTFQIKYMNTIQAELLIVGGGGSSAGKIIMQVEEVLAEFYYRMVS